MIIVIKPLANQESISDMSTLLMKQQNFTNVINVVKSLVMLISLLSYKKCSLIIIAQTVLAP